MPQSAAPPTPAGLPSNRQIVVPPSSAPIWQFHMIQPVALYQWKRSPVATLGADVVVQRGQLQRFEHHAAVAVHDRLSASPVVPLE